MILRRHRFVCSIALALAATLSACAGADLTLPEDATPAHIEIVTGNAQAGIVGDALALPLVVKVTDDLGRPVRGQAVEYTVQSGDGQVSPTSVSTDIDGRASSVWTLGATAGPQETEARAVGGGAPDNLVATFTATAVAGTGSLLAAVGGDDQSASANSVLPESLLVRASDGSGNPVSGVTVHWTAQGGGSISPETVVTGADGRAAAQRVLGATAGRQTAQATADGLAGSPVTFVHTALASSPTALVQTSGNDQTAPAGFEVAEDLVVQLTDANGNGVGGRPVTWVVATGGGTVSPVNSTTDADGFARTRWTLGTSVGTNTLNAVFSGLPPVPFAATASADVPSKLTVVSGDNQSGVVGQPLASPFVVRVADANDNPVENVSVTWTAIGGGSVSSATSATSADGLAQVTRTLGPVPSTYLTTAEVSGIAGVSLTFTSTATVGPPARLVMSVQPGAAAQNGAPLSPQPVIQLQDALGNNVPAGGRNVSAQLVSSPSGAVLGGATTKQSNAGGSAAFTDLRITGPVGRYTLRFTSGTLTAVTSTQVVLSAGAVSGSQSALSASPASVAAGAASTVTVTARDAGGNPVQGATVVLAASGSGNTIGQPSGATNASGVATGTFSSTTLGDHTITATINGTAITDDAVVTVTAGAVSASRSTVAAAPDPIQVGGVPSVVTVTARDADGNPVSGASVNLSATGNGNTLSAPGLTNASGVTTATFTSTQTGPHVISATINGVAIIDNTTVTVTPASVSASQSTVNADPNTIASGATANVTVTARDASGNPIQGASVTLFATGSGNTLGQPGATGPGGIAIGTFSSTGVGAHTITATINGTPITDNSVVIVTSGPVSAAQSTVSASPGLITAGGAGATITITARDAGGSPVAGATVVLSASGSGNSFSAAAPTNGSGVTTATFSSTQAGDHVISATINGTAITDNATVTVQAAQAATLAFTTQPTTTTANQVIDPPVVVAVRDAFGNPASGTVVMSLIVPIFASGTLSGTLSVPAVGGTATFPDLSVDDPAIFSYRLTATLGSISVNSAGFLITP